MTPADFADLELILHRILTEAAPWVEGSCGRVRAETKGATQGVEATAINQAVSEIDRGLQDRVLGPVMERFPQFMPLVEERTPFSERYREARGETAFILDPIDGTLSYLSGRRDYSTLAAVSVGGRLRFGCVALYHPLRFHFAVVPETVTPTQGDAPESLRIVCHYRLFRPPFHPIAERLTAAGCVLRTIPAETGEEGLGSAGPAMSGLIEGRWDAYLAPHVNLHDFAGPWCLAEAAGCTCVRFAESSPERSDDWRVGEPRFVVPSAAEYPVRYRILIARTEQVARRVLSLLPSSH